MDTEARLQGPSGKGERGVGWRGRQPFLCHPHYHSSFTWSWDCYFNCLGVYFSSPMGSALILGPTRKWIRHRWSLCEWGRKAEEGDCGGMGSNAKGIIPLGFRQGLPGCSHAWEFKGSPESDRPHLKSYLWHILCNSVMILSLHFLICKTTTMVP